MAAMELQCRVELGEGGWGSDDAKLLERFDAERKEWESQLRDMQRNIEELYNEVKARREGNTAGLDISANTETSGPSEPPSQHSNGYFHSDSPNQYGNGYNNSPGYHRNGYYDPSYHHGNTGSITQPGHCINGGYDHVGFHSNGYSYTADPYSNARTDPVEAELEEILHSCLGRGLEHPPSPGSGIRHRKPPTPLSPSSCTHGQSPAAVPPAVKGVPQAREDQHSSHDIIRKQMSQNRSEAGSPWLEAVENRKNKQSDLDSRFGNTPGLLPTQEHAWVPPIPSSTTSCYMNTFPDPQLPVQEPHPNRKCTSPCALTDRKCTSPSVLRKFGAMLQENEGKTLTDSGVLVDCNNGGSPKSSAFVSVHKWPGDISTERDCAPDYRPADSQQYSRAQHCSVDRESVNLRASAKSPWRPQAVGQRGQGRELEEDMCISGRPRAGNWCSAVQYAEHSGSGQAMGPAWDSSENACRQSPPTAQPQIEAESKRSPAPIKKSFSRPVRPANRRPPSRWANRMASSSATSPQRANHTPSSTPLQWANHMPSSLGTRLPPSPFPAHKQTLYPHCYQMETVIM
ncbi:hypothetical protein JZ751_005479 [Albula glossodonta]|uniref:SOGA 1/2-like coiled-coil domain-containing protein n=1 Tax=Albula glossodonta TaxID=121402 RepID=A0A8T2N4S7_9TELE|nr:hypothetical protein JZ751_005479 [Albula glossodonta]